MATHPIVHMEISAADPAAASKFYSDLFGWKIVVDPRFNYHQFSAGGSAGAIDGAFVATDGETYKPGDIIPYIGTDDIDGMLKRVEDLGGRILQPKTEIPGTGWFAFFVDPTGNRIGLYTGMENA